MNSKTLKENGIAEFYPLKELSLLNIPNNTGQVFVLIDKTLAGKPSSDVLYIGRAKKPVKKIFGGYLGGAGGKTAKKIHNALINENFVEKVSIGWMSSEDPKALQTGLLEKFKKEHGDFPSWNLWKSPAKEKVKVNAKSKSAIVKTKKSKPQSA